MTQPKKHPLAGIRVVDFSLLAAGPLASKLLADYGAEVILVESEVNIASSGGSRQAGPPGKSPINTAWFHNKYNPNKLSVTVDLTLPEGQEVVKRLVAISDVFIANRRQQVLEKLGVSYEALRAVKPDLIYLAMPTMGSGGKRSFYSGVSWGIQALAGIESSQVVAQRLALLAEAGGGESQEAVDILRRGLPRRQANHRRIHFGRRTEGAGRHPKQSRDLGQKLALHR